MDTWMGTARASPVNARLSLRNKLYMEIDNSLTEKEVRNLRAVLGDHLGGANVEKATPLEICKMLEENNEIGEGRLGLLIEVLKGLNKTKLAQEAEELQKKEAGAAPLENRKRFATGDVDNTRSGKHFKSASAEHAITSDHEISYLQPGRDRASSNDSDDIEDFPDIPFKGRQDELSRIKKNFKDGCRIGLISGMPGVGKSRLAKEAAMQISMESQEQNTRLTRHRLDVANFKSTNLVIDSIFASLLVDDFAGTISTPESLATALKKVKQCEDFHLFICDNADSILEDEELQSQLLDVIRRIVRASSKVFFLITSCRKFRLAKERKVFFTIHVPPLYQDEAADLLTTIAPDVPPDHVTEIVNLCGRLPLALTIAGNELDSGEGDAGYTSEELIELLRRAVMESPLTDEGYSKSEQVGHVLSSALHKLTKVLKRHYAELNFIPGSFNTKAATAVTGKESTAVAKADALRPLRQRSLLEFDDSQERWAIHPLLQNLVQTSLSSHMDVGVTRRRYCIFFADALKEIGEAMARDASRSMQNLTNEFPNIQKMMLEAVNCADEDSYRAFIGAVSEGETVMNQYIPCTSIIPFYQACLSSATVQGTPEEQGKLLTVLGRAKGNHLGQYAEAFGNYMQAKALLEPLGMSTTMARLYSNIGYVYHTRGDYKTAISYLNDSLEMWERLRHGPSVGKSMTLATLGMVHGFIGNLKEAQDYHTRCLEMRIEMYGENHPMVGPAQNNLAIIYDKMADLEHALDLHLSALGLKRRWFDRPNQSLVNSLNGVAIQFMFQKEYGKALKYLQEAEKMQKEVAGSGRHSVYTNLNLGKVLVYTEQYKDAESHLKLAAECYQEQRGSNVLTAEAFEFLGMALHGLGRHSEAKEALTKSLSIYENESANVDVNKDIPRLRLLLDKVNICGDSVHSKMATGIGADEKPLMTPNNSSQDMDIDDVKPDLTKPTSNISEELQAAFIAVAEETGYRWTDLARRLGLTEAQIQDVVVRHQGRLMDSCMDVLETWRKRPSPKATIQLLQNTLLDCGLKAIAERIDASNKAVEADIVAHKNRLSGIFYTIAEDTPATKWKDLARKLGLKSAQIDSVETRHPTEIKECCMDVLETWRLREGGTATVQALQQALREADLVALADEVGQKKRSLYQ